MANWRIESRDRYLEECNFRELVSFHERYRLGSLMWTGIHDLDLPTPLWRISHQFGGTTVRCEGRSRDEPDHRVRAE